MRERIIIWWHDNPHAAKAPPKMVHRTDQPLIPPKPETVAPMSGPAAPTASAPAPVHFFSVATDSEQSFRNDRDDGRGGAGSAGAEIVTSAATHATSALTTTSSEFSETGRGPREHHPSADAVPVPTVPSGGATPRDLSTEERSSAVVGEAYNLGVTPEEYTKAFNMCSTRQHLDGVVMPPNPFRVGPPKKNKEPQPEAEVQRRQSPPLPDHPFRNARDANYPARSAAPPAVATGEVPAGEDVDAEPTEVADTILDQGSSVTSSGRPVGGP